MRTTADVAELGAGQGERIGEDQLLAQPDQDAQHAGIDVAGRYPGPGDGGGELRQAPNRSGDAARQKQRVGEQVEERDRGDPAAAPVEDHVQQLEGEI